MGFFKENCNCSLLIIYKIIEIFDLVFKGNLFGFFLIYIRRVEDNEREIRF